MNGSRFDFVTRALATGQTRREILRFGLGSGLATLGFGQVTQDVLACVKTGKSCTKGKKNGNCCSGTCKKGKCRPTPGAAGCTVKSEDACLLQSNACPNNSAGSCVKLDNGKPFCHEYARCEPCASDSSCTLFPGGKCVKSCPVCQAQSGGQVCLYPQAMALES